MAARSPWPTASKRRKRSSSGCVVMGRSNAEVAFITSGRGGVSREDHAGNCRVAREQKAEISYFQKALQVGSSVYALGRMEALLVRSNGLARGRIAIASLCWAILGRRSR